MLTRGWLSCGFVNDVRLNWSLSYRICFLGDRLLARYKIENNETGELECNKFDNGSIYAMYCGRHHVDDRERDPDCRYFREHNVSLRAGIPGLGSDMFFSK